MIGLMRHRITLLTPVRTPDGGGGASISWQTIATVWAQVEALRSSADNSALQDTPLFRKRFTIRHRDDLGHAMRVGYQGKNYEIRSVRPREERNRFLVLETEEIRS